MKAVILFILISFALLISYNSFIKEKDRMKALILLILISFALSISYKSFIEEKERVNGNTMSRLAELHCRETGQLKNLSQCMEEAVMFMKDLES